MAKSVLISIKPRWCELIASGQKTIEVRKTRPTIETPFKCYIYCTKNKQKEMLYEKADGAISENGKHFSLFSTGKVIGEFVCDKVNRCGNLTKSEFEQTCLTKEEFLRYGGEFKSELFAWHISDLKIYDTSKEVSSLYAFGVKSINALNDTLCEYCSSTDYGSEKCYATPDGYFSCEGAYCNNAYEAYLESFKIEKAPQSWCYVEEQEG